MPKVSRGRSQAIQYNNQSKTIQGLTEVRFTRQGWPYLAEEKVLGRWKKTKGNSS